jgi:hypothetical protein
MTILMMLLSSFRVNRFNLIEGDLCINMNNHQKSTFHLLGIFLIIHIYAKVLLIDIYCCANINNHQVRTE